MGSGGTIMLFLPGYKKLKSYFKIFLKYKINKKQL